MVRPNVDQLKADAFRLSKILATYKVKLSSQQCLDALARLHWNQPYEAVSALAAAGGQADDALEESRNEGTTLADWMECSRSFCEILQTLERSAVNQAVWNGEKVSERGLQWDARVYLRAAGVGADSFSRTAEQLVRGLSRDGLGNGLVFSVESCEPIVDGQIALMRIRRLARLVGRDEPGRFTGLGMRQDGSEHILYGAESRVALCAWETEFEGARTGPYNLAPGVHLSYRVSGREALLCFASVLDKGWPQKVWKVVGPFEVTTHLNLTRNGENDLIDEDWKTSDDAADERIVKFCREASKISDEETPDWPPYVELYVTLDGTSSQEDLHRYIVGLCAHAVCIEGGGAGRSEIDAEFAKEHPQRYGELMLERALARRVHGGS